MRLFFYKNAGNKKVKEDQLCAYKINNKFDLSIKKIMSNFQIRFKVAI